MSETPPAAFLRDFALFADLTDAQVDELARHAAEERFASGRMIFRYGETADRVYLVRAGRIAVEVSAAHGSVVIQTLGAGEVLGFSWLFPPYQWYFDARALEDTSAVALDARGLRERCDADPELGYALVKCFSAVMHQRMVAARAQVLDLYGPVARAN
ncbi:MAG: Crp/Fnr family transcriptional regulator [Gammaproteobacteria bacterium]